jgi:hypothetical protein
MAWYTSCGIRYKGRLIEVTLRYGVYHYEKVISGKPNITIGAKHFYIMLKKKPHISKYLDQQEEAMSGCSCGCTCC